MSPPRRCMMKWTPPDDPDPSEILNAAVYDTRNGAHAQVWAMKKLLL